MSGPVVAIVVAAGSGVRLGGTGPKALRHLAGRPLVCWAVDALAAGGVRSAVVVVAAGLEADFEAVLGSALIPVTVVVGGATRQESVARGLATLPDDGQVVLVHDAARPLVPVEVVRRVVDAVRSGALAVTPVVPVTDTIRQLSPDQTSAVVDRSRLRAVQTPQGFDRDTLVQAHAGLHDEVTDDVAACEAIGVPVTLVAGSREALKITEPFDLIVAQALLSTRGGPG
jgi:2-C-methyl-D-erythritol 4-phosphate cytidylyltransferase